MQLRFDIANSSLPAEYKERLLALRDWRITDEGVRDQGADLPQPGEEPGGGAAPAAGDRQAARNPRRLLLGDPRGRGSWICSCVPGGKHYGFEFKYADAPGTTKSMHVAVQDLALEHLWVVYPGRQEYTLDERITAIPIDAIPRLVQTLR